MLRMFLIGIRASRDSLIPAIRLRITYALTDMLFYRILRERRGSALGPVLNQEPLPVSSQGSAHCAIIIAVPAWGSLVSF